jgi:hypothetical protein
LFYPVLCPYKPKKTRVPGFFLLIIIFALFRGFHEYRDYKDTHIDDVSVSMKGKWTHYEFPRLPRNITGDIEHRSVGIDPGWITSIVQDRDFLWVGTFGSAIWRMKQASGR